MKRHAPATERNRDAIAAILRLELPDSGTVLEIASGSGEHALYFAGLFAQLRWVPSDPDPEAVTSIAAYRDEAESTNLAAPLHFATTDSDWPVESADAIFCANMIHISPWKSTTAMFHHAQSMLSKIAPLILYGPFIEANIETAASNIAFDQSLRMRNPDWGIRHLGELDELADASGFRRAARHEMPANNLAIVYRRI
ncbi:DUF938 domain-containing protein [Aurantiacibacter sediminis]|uniref:DUF938 domain-containing protein n=1 Tax=Aurantiacibacter sediminis TaxID=2793064 RepID=A0ABS0N5F4_9SPHN|nr:DUF938 domain-containing protein [Aurantiacibacter sediminis]MBH5323032.1 DUF938 domain-containing protein [Aurantiacibacter sediminis]